MYTYIYICVHTYIYVYKYVRIYLYIHTYVFCLRRIILYKCVTFLSILFTHAFTYTYWYIQLHIRLNTCIHTYIHTNSFTQEYIRIFTQTYKHVYVCIYMQICTGLYPCIFAHMSSIYAYNPKICSIYMEQTLSTRNKRFTLDIYSEQTAPWFGGRGSPAAHQRFTAVEGHQKSAVYHQGRRFLLFVFFVGLFCGSHLYFPLRIYSLLSREAISFDCLVCRSRL